MRRTGVVHRRAWATLAMSCCALVTACQQQPGQPSASHTGMPASSVSPAARCPSGSSPDRAGPADQARPALLGPTVLAAMSAQGPQVVVGEQGLEPSGSGTWRLQATWTFDVCSNNWLRVVEQSPVPAERRPALGQLVQYADPGVVLGLPVGLVPVWTYDAARGTWAELPAQDTRTDSSPMAVYDGDARRLLAWEPNGGQVRAYNLSSNIWAVLDAADAGNRTRPTQRPEDVGLLSYDSSAGLLLLILTEPGSREPGRTWAFDVASRTWQRRSDVPNPLAKGYPEGWAAVYDPGTQRTYVFGDTLLLSYDARSDTWTTQEPGPDWPRSVEVAGHKVDPLARAGHALVHDPYNSRLMVLGGSVRPKGDEPGGVGREAPDVATDDVWAYDPRSSAWTRLLAASDRPASLGPG